MKRLCLITVALIAMSQLLLEAQSNGWTIEDALASNGGGWFTMYEGVYRDPYPAYLQWGITVKFKKKVIDSSYLRVDYDADILIDSLSGKRGKDWVRTLVGKKYILSNGNCFWMDVMRQSKPEDDTNDYDYTEGCFLPLMNWFVYRNMFNRTVENIHAVPLMAEYAIQYDEPQPTFDWQVSADTLTVCGYLCQRADTDYCGRHWTVWFTPDIPVDCGLWKFSGLPGLILKAEDSELYYSFTAWSIKNTKEGIDLPTSITIKKLSREKFRSVEKNRFDSPMLNCWNGKNFQVGVHVGMKGTEEYWNKIFTPENYTNPHYPMERE